jgi:heme exporter protein D
MAPITAQYAQDLAWLSRRMDAWREGRWYAPDPTLGDLLLVLAVIAVPLAFVTVLLPLLVRWSRRVQRRRFLRQLEDGRARIVSREARRRRPRRGPRRGR